MRERLERIARLRAHKVTKRQAELAAAELARDRAASEVQILETRIREARRERVELARLAPGESLDAARVELRGRRDKALEADIRATTRRHTIAQRGLGERETALAQVRATLKDAERARDQMETLEQRVAREEARLAEIREELDADGLPARRPIFGGGDP